MRNRVARRLSSMGVSVVMLAIGASGCNNTDSTGPSLVPQNEVFTGTLQPQGVSFKTFTVQFTAAPTNLSVVVNSLTTVATSTPITGTTIGVGFGGVSGGVCVVQIQNPAALLGEEQSVPGGVSAGTFCVQLSDCPPNTSGCTSKLTEPVTYSMTVKHF